MALSEEQRQFYKKKGEEYTHSKKGIESAITFHKERLEQLELELRKMHPQTPNGEVLCQKCDVISMTSVRDKMPNSIIYRCEICGNEIEYLCNYI